MIFLQSWRVPIAGGRVSRQARQSPRHTPEEAHSVHEGAGQASGSSSSPGRAADGRPDPSKRWATTYCWDFADGKCKKTTEECGRPHLTHEEAKAKAEGKTWGDKGYNPGAEKGTAATPTAARAVGTVQPANARLSAFMQSFAAVSSPNASRPE